MVLPSAPIVERRRPSTSAGWEGWAASWIFSAAPEKISARMAFHRSLPRFVFVSGATSAV